MTETELLFHEWLALDAAEARAYDVALGDDPPFDADATAARITMKKREIEGALLHVRSEGPLDLLRQLAALSQFGFDEDDYRFLWNKVRAVLACPAAKAHPDHQTALSERG